MIEIKNINISYNSHDVIRNSEICIHDGVLTGISGASGSGKTSLFYIIGLISSIRGYEYFYNGEKIDIDDDKLKSSIRKSAIGFVFQDKNLHEYLSIEDNLKLYSYISGKEYSHDYAVSILKKVHIDLEMSTLTKTLSGGEKQRLAIACALMKKPEFIIADEPTSALDDANAASVIEVLKEIAREGKMVIIATHSKDVLAQCEIKYFIENKSIKCVQEIEKVFNQKHFQKSSLYGAFYSWYAKFSFGRKKYEKNLMLFIPAFIISLCIIGISLKDDLTKYYGGIINALSANEVLVENKDNDISETGYELLTKVDGVEDIHYVYFDLLNELQFNGQTISFDNDIIIKSYYDYQKEYFKLENNYGDGDIYLSYSLAKKLNLEETNTIEIDSDVIKQKGYNVAGTFKQDYNLTQTKEQDVIYVPYQCFKQMPSNMILLKLISFQDFDGISEKIRNINPNYNILLSQSKYLTQISFLNVYRDNISTFLIVLISSVIILLSIINIFTISSQKYEISVLEANGLSRREVVKLMIYTTFKSIINSLVIVVFVMIVANGMLSIIGIPNHIFSLEIVALALFFICVIYFVPNLLATFYLTHFDVEKILRF